MERDSSACRHIVLQCLNADKMEALYSTADKMKKNGGTWLVQTV